MIDIRNFDLFLRYYNEARKVSPPQWQEKKEMPLSTAIPNSAKKHSEDKVVFETSFPAYSEMKVHL